jgi:glutamate-5-semialdehyde dehydrogenase
MNEIFELTKRASRSLLELDAAKCNSILLRVADAIVAESDSLLEANAMDLAAMDKASPLYDRLMLTRERLEGIAADMRKVASLPSPLGRTLVERILPNGLELKKISVPFGVIGVIYEARPNVTFDVFSLCFKSGSACLLKGGRDADNSNRAAVALIKRVVAAAGADPDAVNLMPATHEAAQELLEAVGYVDLVIPRGGRRLINFVRDNAKVPCIETGAGVVNTYFDESGDMEKGIRIVTNAKTRRVSVCNALDCLIVHSSRLADLPALLEKMSDRVTVYADERAYKALEGRYPAERLMPAGPESFGTEFMDYKMAVKTVDSLQEALDHIRRYGSGHSEAIVTEDAGSARAFQRSVDAACVYVNAPTSFTDGAQFGLGAEIGISTQKLGARGPMGLEEICSYKWLIEGNGQTRP